MVIATTIYSCGPAALATILKNLGIYTTEAELAQLAGTDETGTSLYGLKTAAQSKGVNAVGARLTIDQLQPNYLVVLDIDGTRHFEIIRNITNTTVYLFDPNLGDLEMTREKFNELYTGVSLIINGQAPVNATLLTDDEMRNIKALWHIAKVEHSYWMPGYWYPTTKWVTRSFSYPTIKFNWTPGYLWKGWLPIPGHYEARIVWKRANINIPTIIWKYQKPRKKTYYTYKQVPDTSVANTLTLNEAQGIIQNHPNAFQYDAMGTLRVQLKDPHQQGGLMIVSGAAACAVGFWSDGMGLIADGFLTCFDLETPPQVPTFYRIPS